MINMKTFRFRGKPSSSLSVKYRWEHIVCIWSLWHSPFSNCRLKWTPRPDPTPDSLKDFLVWSNGYSRPTSSLVAPERGAGAGVEVGMLRSGGDSLQWKCFRVSKFRSFEDSNLRSFKVSEFQRFNKSFNVFVARYWSHLTKQFFHVFWKRLIPYSRFPKTN